MIDRRRNYVMVIDTETANTIQLENGKLDMSNVLIYDCGWAVVDTKGHIYETASFVNRDIFVDERALMNTAYYASKIPLYVDDLRAGRRIMANTYEIRQKMLDTIEKYGIKAVAAHNARFDYNALNILQRYITSSKYRYWFPLNSVEIWDTLKMSQDVICKMPTYKKFCEEHGYKTLNNQCKKTAEILYRFISGNNDFVESHTGLEDVLIEAEIMFYCFRQHKPMRKRLFEEQKEHPELTKFQIDLTKSLKENPTINFGTP